MKILLINGVNINMLGVREPDVYGEKSYSDLIEFCNNHARDINIELETFISNIEGEIVEKIQGALNVYEGIIINPGAYSHTSVAILDALKSVDIPTIEVHITNIFSRDEFRQKLITAQGCFALISGLGFYGYALAMDAMVEKLCRK